MADSDVQLEEEIRRGEHARQIVEDDLFRETVSAMREALISGIQRSAFIDEKLREKLCQRLALLEDLVGQLKTHMETGKFAAEEIRQKSLREKVLSMAQRAVNW